MAERQPNLAKYMSRCGAASRRAAAELIRSGRVTVNGDVATDPARRVEESDAVSLDGRTLSVPERFIYIMLNKPRGYVCSNADAHADKLAVELIDRFPGRLLRSAGRLDKESEGLIVFSDDGGYLERAAHPRYMVAKLYEVTTAREIPEPWLDRMTAGVCDEGETLRVLEVVPLGGKKYRFKLNEGRKREIRRLCRAAGAPVESLKRTAMGKLKLGTLASGDYRELSPEEVALSLVPDAAATRPAR